MLTSADRDNYQYNPQTLLDSVRRGVPKVRGGNYQYNPQTLLDSVRRGVPKVKSPDLIKLTFKKFARAGPGLRKNRSSISPCTLVKVTEMGF